jgi:hypothetical protein
MRSLIEDSLPDPISEEHMKIYLTERTRIGTPELRNI